MSESVPHRTIRDSLSCSAAFSMASASASVLSRGVAFGARYCAVEPGALARRLAWRTWTAWWLSWSSRSLLEPALPCEDFFFFFLLIAGAKVWRWAEGVWARDTDPSAEAPAVPLGRAWRSVPPLLRTRWPEKEQPSGAKRCLLGAAVCVFAERACSVAPGQ